MLLAALLIATSTQTIDGVKQIFDSAPKFAQAFVTRSRQEPSLLEKSDPFITAFFMSKAKTMAPLTQTKYTAAQMGICGTILTVFDPILGGAIRSATDRIGKGTKDFDSLTEEEKAALMKAYAESKLLIVGEKKTTATEQWQFFAGSHLGMLAGYITLWHISPKQPTLLQFIADGVKGCAEHGAKPEATTDLAASFKGFGKFVGKTIDEPTAREIGAQIEEVLKAATPLKYRW